MIDPKLIIVGIAIIQICSAVLLLILSNELKG